MNLLCYYLKRKHVDLGYVTAISLSLSAFDFIISNEEIAGYI
jgi:hypothetical protein